MKTGFPCAHILSQKNLFSWKGIMFSLQGSCFHNKGVSLIQPSTRLPCMIFLFLQKHVKTIKKVCSSHNSYFFILLSNYNSSHHSVYLQLDKRWKIDLSRCVKLFPAQHHFHDECSHHMILMRGWHIHRSSSHSAKLDITY